LLKGSTVSLTREEWIILILGTPDTEPVEIGAVLPDDCGSGGETLASRIEVVGLAQYGGIAPDQLLCAAADWNVCCEANRYRDYELLDH
jgi:hypothetical protein